MIRGRKPKPTAIRRQTGNPGKRGYNPAEPVVPPGLPDCPGHLSNVAGEEWERIAGTLYEMGVLTTVDRAVLAAYCQAYGRWVEAEERMKETPAMLKTPSGYVQQSSWLSVANKQLELMGRFMSELGITPASRSRVRSLIEEADAPSEPVKIVFSFVDADGNEQERPISDRTERRRVSQPRQDVAYKLNRDL